MFNYTDTGEFLDWFYTGDSLYSFVDLQDFLLAQHYWYSSEKLKKSYPQVVYNTTNRFFPNMSTIDFNQYELNIKLYYMTSETTEAGFYTDIYFVFNDSSKQTIFTNFSFGYNISYQKSFILKGNLTKNKFVTKLEVNMTTQTLDCPSGDHVDHKIIIYDENYKIYLPRIENEKNSPEIYLEQYKIMKFACDIYEVPSQYFPKVLIRKNDSDDTISFNLDLKDAFNDYHYFKFIQFNITGLYFWQIRVFNLPNNYTETDLQYFYVESSEDIYPKETHLTLWSPSSDLSLTGSLKLYLGEDELVRICDFETQYLDRGTNLQWITTFPGSINSYEVKNKRLYWQTKGGGIRTVTEAYYNTSYYDSFIFRLKIKSTSELNNSGEKKFYICFNPVGEGGLGVNWDMDYRLNLTPYWNSSYEYINKWTEFIIPFKLFNVVSKYNEFLGAIGFYSPSSNGVLNCEIRNIYLGNYNYLTTILNNTGESYITNETIIRTDLNPLIFEFQNTTSQIFEAIKNQTISQNITFDSGFNNSKAIWENITIPSNSSILLENYQWWNSSYVYKNSIEINSSQALTNKMINITTSNNFFLSDHIPQTSIRITNKTQELDSSIWDMILNARYNFENDSTGGDPTNWTIDEGSEGSNCHVDILARKGNHKKVVEFWDNNLTDRVIMQQQNIGHQDKFFLEFWIQSNCSNPAWSIRLQEGASIRARLGVRQDDSRLKLYNRHLTGYDYVANFSLDVWYHVRVFFDCISDTVKYWVNGSYLGEYEFYLDATSYLDDIAFMSGNSDHDIPQFVWVDGIDYSWENNYYENRNQHLEDCQINFNVSLKAETPKNYYLYYDNQSKESYDGGLNRVCDDFVNITIQNRESYNSSLEFADGYYISEWKTFSKYVKITNITFNWSDNTNTNIDIYLRNETSSWLNYSDFINSICSKVKFKVLLNITKSFKFAELYNLTLNYTYFQFILSENITRQFNFPQASLKNFSFGWCGKTNISIDSANLNIYNFSSNTFYKIDNISNTSQILSYTNNSNFYSIQRNFTWNINATYENYYGFSITQINYKISYYRYVFDRQVRCLNISLVDSEDYSFSFTSLFSNSSALLQICFNTTLIFNITKTETYPKLYRFSDLVTNPDLIKYILLNFILFNCSQENENASILLSNVFLFQNNTNRLLDESNRQMGNTLIFQEEIQTLLMVDYYNDVIYREVLNRSEIGAFTDIEIPFFKFIIRNEREETITISIEKENIIQYISVPGNWYIELNLILMDYRICWIVSNVKTVIIYDGVMTRTTSKTITADQLIPLLEALPYLLQAQETFGEKSWYDQIMDNNVGFIIYTIIVTAIPTVAFYYGLAKNKGITDIDDIAKKFREGNKESEKLEKQKTTEKPRKKKKYYYYDV